MCCARSGSRYPADVSTLGRWLSQDHSPSCPTDTCYIDELPLLPLEILTNLLQTCGVQHGNSAQLPVLCSKRNAYHSVA